MFYFPRSRPRRESEWRTSSPTEMPHTVKQAPSSERVRVLPGMSPDTVLVTGYTHDGTPLTRMEIPRRWLTAEWIAWLERRCAGEDEEQPVQLKLLG